MNERIKKLAEQATTYIDPSANDGVCWNFDKEKFAELIVAECSKVIMNGGYRNPAFGEKHPLTPPEITTMIQEHFGVEE